MIKLTTVAAALASIAEMQGREVTKAQVKAVHAMIAAEFNDETFAAACRQVARTCKWMPTPADFLEALEADRVDQDQEAAAQAWGLVYANSKCMTHNPVSGSRYDPHKVAAVAGEEVAEAWIEASLGPLQTLDERTIAFARKEFIAVFSRRRRRERRASAGLLTAGPVAKALPAAPVAMLPPSRDEAKAVLGKVEERAGVTFAEGAKRARRVLRPEPRELTEAEWEDRQRELKRQQAELAAEAAEGGGRPADDAE